jgi:putative ABC transport system permease protein
MTLLARMGSNPTGSAPANCELVRQLDPEIALRGVKTLEEEAADSIALVRIRDIRAGILGVVVLALSAIGVYGVFSESVARRAHELGVRFALGANPADLMKLLLGQALKLTGIGLAIAVQMSLAISKALTSLVFGIVSADFPMLLGIALLFVLVPVGASHLPACRAMRLDPMISLRHK